MPSPCSSLATELGALFSCTERKHGYRIRTPYLYPDGDIIDLYYQVDGTGRETVSDLGETIRWLRLHTLSHRRSPKQSAMIQDVCLNHGVEFFKGRLQARVREGETATQVIMRVAQAALRASDIWFTFRTRAMQSVSDDVAEFLSEQSIGFERSPRLTGRSGSVWSPDFQTRTPEKSSLVYVLSSGSRAISRGIRDRVTAAWYDLSFLKVGRESLQFVSLFDDSTDVWNDEDYHLIEMLSNVARWSAPDEFDRLLRTA